ncbi:sialidase family protein [Shewanella sp. Isolate7]|uniref:sialidase family protein n=1 Tax=Shewanella sp. Isolate7 TaxID=2908528 RepID=UPI001EFC5F76|nr:sialidase family protein [Shewanella sp. Isolate7]MCG9721591.1 glycoside hydrolase [Shewanella sp. Isolate7]
MKLISVAKIWDASPHNAFTDLVRFKNKLYCVFRQASAHVSPDGALRILRSDNEGQDWQSIALVDVDFADLRDGKLVADNDRLLLFGGGAMHEGKGEGMRSYCWQSHDGEHWSAPKALVKEKEWLWRITPHKGHLYGIAYLCHEHDGYAALYKSDADRDFQPLVEKLSQAGYVNESGLVFDEHDKAICLLRRDPLWQTDERALLGESEPPYTQWRWQTTNCRVGGPVTFLYQSKLYGVVRLYDDRVRTSLVAIDRQTAQIEELLTLPSGGDISYAGVVLKDDTLMLSYYSSHEGTCAIYFAKIAL